MSSEFSTLEKNILKAKGLSEAQVAALTEAGVASRGDLQTVGDASTLADLVPDIDPSIASKVMEWATGRSQASAAGPSTLPTGNVLLDTADVVYCVHCHAKQPKDYKSGDLCIRLRRSRRSQSFRLLLVLGQRTGALLPELRR